MQKNIKKRTNKIRQLKDGSLNGIAKNFESRGYKIDTTKPPTYNIASISSSAATDIFFHSVKTVITSKISICVFGVALLGTAGAKAYPYIVNHTGTENTQKQKTTISNSVFNGPVYITQTNTSKTSGKVESASTACEIEICDTFSDQKKWTTHPNLEFTAITPPSY